jgi:hypothetical protein
VGCIDPGERLDDPHAAIDRMAHSVTQQTMRSGGRVATREARLTISVTVPAITYVVVGCDGCEGLLDNLHVPAIVGRVDSAPEQRELVVA